jgi:hypothetical protein
MISHEFRCIFVHIQKTGGSSIRRALNMVQHDADKHRLAAELRPKYRSEEWNSYFKFAFVRNPWDRLVSWWEMIQQNAAARKPMNGFQFYVLSRATTFEEFVLRCGEDYHDHDGSKCIFRNQVDYIHGDGDIFVDFVGRFETLHEDFERVRSRLAAPTAALPHLNRSTHRHYSSYYTESLRELVSDRYARDIAAFGYRFERQ